MAEPVDFFSACHGRVPAFTRRHFGLLGSLRLHWHALGLDLLRAPLNLLLVGPALCLRLLAALARFIGLKRLSRWLATRRLFVETGLSRRIAHLISTELLQLEGTGQDTPLPSWAERVEELISEYVAARHAVAELAAGLIALMVGLLTLHAITPSAFSLGPLLAQEYAQENALSTFWAGRWAAGWYYWYWPAEATWPETAGFTIALMAVFAVVATFIGVLTDPLQQVLGLHAQRLHRFIRTIERLATDDPEARLGLPDPYLAKAADLVDWVAIGLRYLR
jgi:hypothetical protein